MCGAGSICAVRHKSATVLLAGLALASCANTTGRFSYVYAEGYTASTAAFAAADGATPVVVRNNPFPGDADGAKFAAAMPTDTYWRFKFVNSRPTPGFGYRFVVEFGQDPGPGTYSVCATDLPVQTPLPPDGATDGIPFRAGFCRNGGAISEVAGLAPLASSPGDPAFRNFLANLVSLLTPSIDSHSMRDTEDD
jgi:hypothetical protein